ncbi:hypothetical protein BCV69DRAFT_145472 [Microstroma glucosiphilum]|uniref:Uncharacterized protein n=1 Tax=Pseudomicrostroma glucosiphilum TaxID=1684307 RepID=A0A316UBF7_9BASI|nr:hypothetical protein BCV69DRAFT_145472 [Pseudomicrostroma glucosiphilum]PWN22492.1 hypothetical protein BCV69DRAFT_145472 [Pseudomicrostroma glucosiphilum]
MVLLMRSECTAQIARVDSKAKKDITRNVVLLRRWWSVASATFVPRLIGRKDDSRGRALFPLRSPRSASIHLPPFRRYVDCPSPLPPILATNFLQQDRNTSLHAIRTRSTQPLYHLTLQVAAHQASSVTPSRCQVAPGHFRRRKNGLAQTLRGPDLAFSNIH